VFEKIGHFNENYTECFEDVELNLSLYINGYKNYYVGNAVAYHYESQTRNESDEKQKRMNDDFNDLVPFIQKNINKLSEKIIQY
jgi:GT2 family glycosyltransferase